MQVPRMQMTVPPPDDAAAMPITAISVAIAETNQNQKKCHFIIIFNIRVCEWYKTRNTINLKKKPGKMSYSNIINSQMQKVKFLYALWKTNQSQTVQ